MAASVFEARGLTKLYHMGEVEVQALRGVDLDLYQSEFLVILGPSGSGKSTLLNVLGGLDVPTSGSVRYRDHDLTAANEHALTQYRREHVGFVFQFYNLIPSLTARENVELVTDIATDPMPAADALDMVGLNGRQYHQPAALSGGERQRVTIARALVNDPAIVWGDEPTGDLDSRNAQEIMDLMRRLNREQQITFAIVTHDIGIGRQADRIVRMADGQVVGEEVPA